MCGGRTTLYRRTQSHPTLPQDDVRPSLDGANYILRSLTCKKYVAHRKHNYHEHISSITRLMLHSYSKKIYQVIQFQHKFTTVFFERSQKL